MEPSKYRKEPVVIEAMRADYQSAIPDRTGSETLASIHDLVRARSRNHSV